MLLSYIISFTRLFLSTVRAWFRSTTESTTKPFRACVDFKTSVGYRSSANLERLAATMVTGLDFLAISSGRKRAGRVFRISAKGPVQSLDLIPPGDPATRWRGAEAVTIGAAGRLREEGPIR